MMIEYGTSHEAGRKVSEEFFSYRNENEKYLRR